MTNPDTDAAPKPKSKKKLIALIAAGALVIGGGITATAAGINNYNAETAKLCTLAVNQATVTEEEAAAAVVVANDTLNIVKHTALDNGETSTDYAKRPAVNAVEAKKATDGKPEVKAVAARQSGADFIKAVAEHELVSEELKSSAGGKCTDRDRAAKISKSTKALEASTADLSKKVEALKADFASFQKDEKARIAAEKKAAEEKAAAEAAAAAQAAAAQAAAETYSEPDYSGGGDYDGGSDDAAYSGGGSNSGGGGTIIDPGFGGGGCPAGMICYG